MNIFIKPINQNHRDQIINIYNYYIENSFAAYFERSVPFDFFEQFLKLCDNYPSLVEEDENGNILGFGLLRPYHAFPAFSRTSFIT